MTCNHGNVVINVSVIFWIFRKDPECRNCLCTRQSGKEGFSSLERYSRQRGEVPIQCIPQGSLCGGNTCSGVYRFYISLSIVACLMWLSYERYLRPVQFCVLRTQQTFANLVDPKMLHDIATKKSLKLPFMTWHFLLHFRNQRLCTWNSARGLRTIQ